MNNMERMNIQFAWQYNLIFIIFGVYIYRAIRKSNCFQKRGHGAQCKFSNNPFMIGIGIVEMFLSQIPNIHKLSWLSIIAAIMSVSYAGIGMGLAFTKAVLGKLISNKWASMGSRRSKVLNSDPNLELWTGHGETTSLAGEEIGPNLTAADKTWGMFSAIGNIAFACAYLQILIEIQVS